MKDSKKIISSILVIMLLMTSFIPVLAKTDPSLVYVRIEGYERTLMEKTGVSTEVFDLEKYGITDQPQEFTALHAILKALESKGYDASDKAIINTNGGAYVSSVLGKDAIDNAGWMYTLNNNSSWNSIKDQGVKAGDLIVLYYIEDWMYSSYAFFEGEDELEIDAFSTIKVELKHHYTDPLTWEVTDLGFSGAKIYINGQESSITTDKNGYAFITFNKGGIYDISARYYVDDMDIISNPSLKVTVKDKGVLVKINSLDKTYVSYVNPKSFDLKGYNLDSDLEFSALHALVKALEDLDFSVTDPKVSNFNGGAYVSRLLGIDPTDTGGWMYVVNNETSWFALNEQALEAGDALELYLISNWMTDSYAFFDTNNIAVPGGESISLRLMKHVTDPVTWEVGVKPVSQADILLNGKIAFLTDANGYVNFSLNTKGLYEISLDTKASDTSFSTVKVNVLSDKVYSLNDYKDSSKISEDYKAYVLKALEDQVLVGDDKQNLRPQDLVTKAEFLTLLVRASGFDVSGKVAKRYIDVDKTDWFSRYAQTVFKYGLAKSDAGYLNPKALVDLDMVSYGLKRVVSKDLDFSSFEPLFVDDLSREEAIYLIYSVMEGK